MADVRDVEGDVDISVPAALMGDSARARLLVALADGRALPASTLAAEAGVAASTCSEHLSKLRAAGLVTVQAQGRHRYYRVGDEQVVQAVEALAQLAPRVPVRSLRQGTRAHALRRARRCYDPLAGRTGVALMAALLDRGVLAGGDGRYRPERARTDRLSAPGHDVDYRLTPSGRDQLAEFGIGLPALEAGRRPLIRYCLDWTEQAHHLAGALGGALANRMFELDWLRRMPIHRAVRLTDAGRSGLAATFGMVVDEREAV
jgi:DNA-binding transcriptional ArsR family regulator